MNTVDDLRATLASHADQLTDQLADGGATARAAAVQRGVRRVRTQRRAIAAGGLAAVLAIGGTAAVLVPTRQSAVEPTAPLAGQVIQRTVVVDGFGYHLGTTAQSAPGATTLHLKLATSDHNRVVALVGSGLGNGRATLFVGNGANDVDAVGGRPAMHEANNVLDRLATDAGVDRPVTVASAATTLTVTVRDAPVTAQVGLAVYDRDNTLPRGVSADGMVFPASSDGKHLITGTIGKRGEDTVSITFQGPVRNPDLESLCATGEKDIWSHLTITGVKGWSGGTCAPRDAIADVDLGVGHAAGVPDGGFGPGSHTVTITSVLHRNGSPDRKVDPADLRLALALYVDPSPTRRIDGLSWDTRPSWQGRAWRLDRVERYQEGRTTVDATDSPVMLGLTAPHGDHACLVAEGADGFNVQFDCDESDAGASGFSGLLLVPGTTYTLSTTRDGGGDKPGTGLGHVLIYRPVS